MSLVGFSKLFFSQNKGFSDEIAFGVVDKLRRSVESTFEDLVDDDTVFFINDGKVCFVDFGDLLELIQRVKLSEDGRFGLRIGRDWLLLWLGWDGFVGG